MACTGDALRRCAEFIPSHAKITACMATKHDQLSHDCMVVFDASAPAPAPKQAKHR